jgi:dihydroflavonol-4-reductase
MKVLLTGATGFIGSAILRQLIQRGDNVRVLARPNSDQKNLFGLDCEIFLGDLNDTRSIEPAIKDCQVLIHVAADYRLWALNPKDITNTNVIGTKNIMRAAITANVERIIYTSSVATLGKRRDNIPANEYTPSSLSDMIGVYKKSKFLAEQEVRRMITDKSLPAIIVNPSAPIGPRDLKPTPTGQIIIKAANGEIPAYIETGLNVVHVDDVARGHILALEKGVIGERYILGGENLTFKEILELVSECTDIAAPTIRIPHNIVLPIAHLVQAWATITKSSEPFVTVDGVRMAKQIMHYDSTKAKLELGYESRPAKEAIQDAIKWFGEHGYLY